MICSKEHFRGKGSGDIFIDDDHNKTYVANTDSNEVSIIDGKRDCVMKVVFFPEKEGRSRFVTANSEKGNGICGD